MGIYRLAPGGIGIKKLTRADMGISAASHQTHIGLYESTLSHFPHERKTYNAQLIYNGHSLEGVLFLKFINGNRSPAINMGTPQEQSGLSEGLVSVGRQIREICNSDRTLDWYLIWFALDNNEIISILFNQNSSEFISLENVIPNISSWRQVINAQDESYIEVAELLNGLITSANIEYIHELEIAVQSKSDTIPSKRIPRVIDIERANAFYKETGKRGEELLNEYLDRLKTAREIKDYKWVNQSMETGYPYDFEITNLDDTLNFSDAKSTSYNFEQKMVLSSSELRFINEHRENYLIHRLYDIGENPRLKVCENISTISDVYISSFEGFNNEMIENNLAIRNTSIAVPTNHELLEFGNEIQLLN